MVRSTHVLTRLKSDIPLHRTCNPARRLLPGGTLRRRRHVPVRVIEYDVDVEGQEVAEMFCLVTDLMDWEDYPAPELAALYARRWDGSETALREAKAPLRGAGPAPGRCSAPAPGPGPAGDRRLGRRHRDDPRGPPRRRPRRRPGRKGRRAAQPVRPRDLSFARALRAILSRSASGTTATRP